MSIHNTVAFGFIFIAIEMFGAGGVIAIEIISGDPIIELLFGIITIVGVIGLFSIFKKMIIADKQIREMEK